MTTHERNTMNLRLLMSYAVYAAALIVPAVVKSKNIHRQESGTREDLRLQREMLKDLYDTKAFQSALPSQQQNMINAIIKNRP